MAENIEKAVTENNYIPTPEDFKIVGPDTTQSEEIYKPSLTFWQDGWRRFKKNKLALSFLGITLIFLFLAIFGQHMTKYSYRAQDLSAKFLSPTKGFAKGHYLGTDNLGRDLFARLSQGIRISMELSIITAAICVIFGTIYGAVSAYFGGIVDTVIMRLGDMMIAFPGLILAIAIAGLLNPSVKNSIIAIAAVTWTKYARLARSMVLKIKQELYVEAAKITGSKDYSIIFKYIIPNMITTMIVTAVSDMGTLMLEIAALSFLGFGAQPPTPEWGAMLNEGRTTLSRAPWMMMYPGLAIVIVVIIFNMLGDSVRDLVDVKSE